MSITRDKGKLVVQCDECHETLETDETNFEMALVAARNEGWQNCYHKGHWFNLCSQACRSAFVKAL